MKESLTKIISLLILLFCLTYSNVTLADDPPPPPPPGSHGDVGNQGPMGAPVGNEVTVFLVFAAAVAGREYYRRRKLLADTN